ncbi:MAG: DUF5103 domain-containing protein [Muribaculaceae bacterium]|nr:DUF5103 domain-containing protein [Bacteroidales bacterium]MDY2733166.1 DUF5103 domain-containing protein [Muribaculaceae bacterium]MDY5387210.1 DUF5103 domain-containing protein [Muribaculaceae bacterium]
MRRTFLTYMMIVATLFTLRSEVDTTTGIFDRRFRTLKTEVEDNFMSPPVIRLGTNDRILVKFDEIGEDNSYLEYRLIHCDADWQPSRLIESEYLEGFNSVRIEDYAYSTATFVHYVNYLIAFPNEELQIKHSGNYLLQVYDPERPEETLLQTRFQVTENIARIEGNVTSRTDMGHNTYWQQLAFEIDCQGIGEFNPYQDIIVYVTQNDREATKRRIMTPLRVSGDKIIYEHLNDLVFGASNEYRRFESVSNSFPGMRVDSLRYMGSNYHVWLKVDEPRQSASYSYDQTQHGRFLVREYNSTDSDIGADYITVHFLLECPELPAYDIYLDGEFTHDRMDKENQLTYDHRVGGYVAEVPLKQGAYNYQYVTRSRQTGEISTSTIEGDKYETLNEYGIAVYFRPPGARADRLISYRILQME